MMKKSLIKKIAMIGAVVVGMLAFGGTTQANASSITPNDGHFDSRTITYHIDSASKHYKDIWNQAIKNWNSQQHVIKLRSTSGKKAMMRLTTVKKTKNNGLLSAGINYTDGSSYLDLKVKLSRQAMDESNYSRNNRIHVAMQGIGLGVGLRSTQKNNGIMSQNVLHSNITHNDISGLKKAYKGVK